MRREDFTDEAPGQLVNTLEGHLAFVPVPLPPPIDDATTDARALS